MRPIRVLVLVVVTGGILALAGCPKKKPVPTPTPTPMASSAMNTPVPAPDCDLNPVYFEFDQALIRSDGRTALRGVAECLSANAEWSVKVAGHADERGSTEYNLGLGERRANAVRDYLINLGVGSRQMATISYGEERPATQGASEDAWSQNRRVEFER